MVSNHLLKKTEAGILLALKVSPKAAKNKLGKIMLDTKGRSVLKVYVTAAPENGEANEAVINLLAKVLQLKKSQLTIYQGKTDKNKTILITCKDKVDATETLYMLLQKAQVGK